MRRNNICRFFNNKLSGIRTKNNIVGDRDNSGVGRNGIENFTVKIVKHVRRKQCYPVILIN